MPEPFKSYVVLGSASPGYSHILRNPLNKNSIIRNIDPDVNTMYQIFENCKPFDPVTKTFGEYSFQTYSQIHKRAENLSSGIFSLRLEKAETLDEKAAVEARNWPVCMYAINRLEWTLTDRALPMQSLYSVALYDTLGQESTEYILNHCEASVVVCSLDKIHKLLMNIDKYPYLKIIISMDPLSNRQTVSGVPVFMPSPYNTGTADILRSWAKTKNVVLHDIHEVEEMGRACPIAHHPPGPEDTYTMLYTSGTTGNPKGAVNTHANYSAAAIAVMSGRGEYKKTISAVSFMPLAHTSGRNAENSITYKQGFIGYYSGDITRILEDNQKLQPTLFTGVPRLYNRFYDLIASKTINAEGLVGSASRYAASVKINNLLKNNEYDHFLFDKMFFNKTKAMISKNLEYAITGSAPIEAHVLNFLRISLKAKMMDFYGMTETSSVALGQNDTDLTVSNSGIPSDGMEVKLRDVPDMNYLVTNSPHPRGEVLIRGPTVFKGYFKDIEKTNETLIGDGWIATGDIGRFNSDGTISIIDRKKALFKLSQGEYVAPEKVENTITKNPLVMQAFVYGISTKDHVVSVVVPDELTFIPWATSLLLASNQKDPSNSLSPSQIRNLSLKQLTENEIVHSNLLKSIQETCRSSKLNGYEIVKAIHIEHAPFDVETNKLITPTFKLKRFDAAKYYKSTLDRLYNLNQ
ncbi:Long chain acyl-CoA synthetase 7, peroxisomal [Smittium culicis]|uniref:Long chain acyl-CoA synthetase 7, peroxisomal n=1 Tax=Smittium culicis TaxID=133412 RepID=A0A1R1XQA6_9FUNG|nr:Long chain acyl-CoA synthetase 7, peroxisomal [Smittium culicis]OMJ17577.1 Long chain acyl-CoA synthetase 7, peroxisomal [Smittium culicis]